MAEIIAIASDHAGFSLKQQVGEILEDKGLQVLDCGTDSEESVDYPEYGKKVVAAILGGTAGMGVLVCGTGIGMSIVANRHQGIRAALVKDAATAAMARKHNNANVLVLPGRQIDAVGAREVISAWLDAAFEGGRHQRRLDAIDAA